VRCFMIPRPHMLVTVMLLMSFGVCAAPTRAQVEGKPPGEAAIDFSADGPSPFLLAGTAPHFGRFACYGEIDFQPGVAEGSLDGTGVAVLAAADGDLIVGVVSCQLDANGVG